MDAERKKLKLKDFEYWDGADKFFIPRQQFLLHHVKEIEYKLLSWYKKNICKSGDNYFVKVSKRGKWTVGFTNDSPLRHGWGHQKTLTEEEFIEAMK